MATNEKPNEKPLKVVELRVDNVKRIQALDVRPDGAPVVRVEGRNGAGKSSAIDAIAYALGGKSLLPDRPVREGEEEARVVVDLGELVVERRWTGGGARTYLEVRARDGAKYGSPQAILDGLCSRVAFDPLAFVREEPRKQAETLRRLAGLDLSAIEAEHRKAYDTRTEANREVKRLEAQLAAQSEDPGAPIQEVNVAAVLEEQRLAWKKIDENRQVRTQVTRFTLRVNELEREAERLHAQAAEIARQLEGLERDLVSERGKCDGAHRASAALVDPDLGAIEVRLRSAGDENRRAQRARAREELVRQLATAAKKADQLSSDVSAAEEKKRIIIASARWPVAELGIDGDTVTWRGLPLAQASSAEQLRVSVAIGFALHPRAKVLLVREGSLLDAESMRLLGESARESDGQVWVERVSDGGLSVLFEDVNPFEAARPSVTAVKREE